ncbi:heavy metal-responsive transcriptional regulator [Actinokineospora xionganensis]|uniref:Heavy metal-responsive transcriptional regulator n=1 Tax=Actinokineospora xionganensis TaxID=2684470 RepID=A0ABR7KZR9_9PSEU|nr:heavy metal-responsive transcriptional regulator [Actinokineospora xionganensis]MBC6445937.1 heavy metal-responsive transcriptional regulator [Actinokineospora xionganensis]
MRIGDLATQCGVPIKTIRFYEEVGVLPTPARTPRGHRDYGPEFIERLRFIRRGQSAGLSLREIRQILAIHDRQDAPCGHARLLLSDRLGQVRSQIAELITLEIHLDALLSRAEPSEPTDHDGASTCRILELNPALPAGTPDMPARRGTR